MGVFRHPHLTRGVVHTAQGAFLIRRGLVEMPDDVGEGQGWVRMTEDTESLPSEGRPTTPQPLADR
jgi:hypothetical protein